MDKGKPQQVFQVQKLDPNDKSNENSSHSHMTIGASMLNTPLAQKMKRLGMSPSQSNNLQNYVVAKGESSSRMSGGNLGSPTSQHGYGL